ncbi:MAG: hypothetical protein WCF22_01930, partial [Candidatus Sulfotelmatobacter sp.]
MNSFFPKKFSRWFGPLRDGVILSAAVFQAKRRISRVAGLECQPNATIPKFSRWFGLVLISTLLAANVGAYPAQKAVSQPEDPANGQSLQPILSYISTAWDTLTRSMTDCESVVDPKIKLAPVLYLP